MVRCGGENGLGVAEGCKTVRAWMLIMKDESSCDFRRLVAHWRDRPVHVVRGSEADVVWDIGMVGWFGARCPMC